MRKFALATSVDVPAASVMVVGSTGVPLVLAEPMRSFDAVPLQAVITLAPTVARRNAVTSFVIGVGGEKYFQYPFGDPLVTNVMYQ